MTRLARLILPGALALALLALSPAPSLASEPSDLSERTSATRLPAPKNIRINWGARAVTVTWNAVSGAESYGVAAFAYRIQGPQPPHMVSAPATSIRIPKGQLPQSSTGGFRFAVNAKAGGVWSSGTAGYTGSARIREGAAAFARHLTFHDDNQTQVDGAVRLVKRCAGDGVAAVVGTGAVGAPFVVWSIPIPGVGEVTGGGLAAVAGVAGGVATVGCFARAAIPWR